MNYLTLFIKSQLIQDLEHWRSRCGKSESRVDEVFTDIKGLIMENDRLNNVIVD